MIQLYKRREALWQQKGQLPRLALEHPYQSGWKRFFVLRDDIKRVPKAAFYEALLAKVNTVEYHHDKSFKRKKRRKGRNVYVVKQQLLREFYPYGWQFNRMKLTEEEQACFTRVDTYDVKTRRLDVKYVITEPWRYVLKVVPYIITHTRPLDLDIERELAYIDVHIDNHQLDPRINTLTRGRRYRWKDEFNERAKYINKFKNISRYSPKEVYLELET
ncbi:MAG: hypothetical protein V4592_10880 [Bacteroidota bacterium]